MGSAVQPLSQTPILDSGARPVCKKKTFGSMALSLLFAIPFAVILIAASNNARETRNAPINYAFAAYLLSIFLAVIVHELGHLCAGLIVGFRFSSISIGPVSLGLEYGRLRVRIRCSLPAGGYAGMHVDRIRRLRRRLRVFILGGPLANLLTAGLVWLLLTRFPPASNWFAAFQDMFWMISIVLGIGNLIPFRVSTLYTDGARVWISLTSKPRARRWLCIGAIGNQIQAGVRPRIWRRTWLDAASRVRDGSVDDFAASWMSYIAANDQRNAALAAFHLERSLELVNLLGPLLQDFVTSEASAFTSWFRQDAIIAEKWLREVKKPKALPRLMQMKAEISLCCAKNEFAQALSQLEQSSAFIEKLPSTPVKSRLQEWLLEWRDEIREREQLYEAAHDPVSSSVT